MRFLVFKFCKIFGCDLVGLCDGKWRLPNFQYELLEFKSFGAPFGLVGRRRERFLGLIDGESKCRGGRGSGCGEEEKAVYEGEDEEVGNEGGDNDYDGHDDNNEGGKNNVEEDVKVVEEEVGDEGNDNDEGGRVDDGLGVEEDVDDG